MNEHPVKSVAVAVVIRDGRVMVQHRYRRQLGMVYEFPCGTVEDGETVEEAAVRELREETNLAKTTPVATIFLTKSDGMQLGFVILRGDPHEEPQETNPVRKQTFLWLKREELPMDEFFPGEQEFIRNDLGKFL
jgi:8-oxo-dGTP diphosphatase